MALSKELLDILACPKCKGDLVYREAAADDQSGAEAALICDACKLLYPVREGIPVMLIDEAGAL
ncbi:MAG: Trm112 family protein [Nitrospirota bacterium]